MPPGAVNLAAQSVFGSYEVEIKPVQPLAPFLAVAFIRASRILDTARRAPLFYRQTMRIARQALQTVVSFNDSLGIGEDPTDEQEEEGIELEDQLLDLDYAMREWTSETVSLEEYQERIRQIHEQHKIFFKNRFYLPNARHPNEDEIFRKLATYDNDALVLGDHPSLSRAFIQTQPADNLNAFIENLYTSPIGRGDPSLVGPPPALGPLRGNSWDTDPRDYILHSESAPEITTSEFGLGLDIQFSFEDSDRDADPIVDIRSLSLPSLDISELLSMTTKLTLDEHPRLEDPTEGHINCGTSPKQHVDFAKKCHPLDQLASIPPKRSHTPVSMTSPGDESIREHKRPWEEDKNSDWGPDIRTALQRTAKEDFLATRNRFLQEVSFMPTTIAPPMASDITPDFTASSLLFETSGRLSHHSLGLESGFLTPDEFTTPYTYRPFPCFSELPLTSGPASTASKIMDIRRQAGYPKKSYTKRHSKFPVVRARKHTRSADLCISPHQQYWGKPSTKSFDPKTLHETISLPLPVRVSCLSEDQRTLIEGTWDKILEDENKRENEGSTEENNNRFQNDEYAEAIFALIASEALRSQNPIPNSLLLRLFKRVPPIEDYSKKGSRGGTSGYKCLWNDCSKEPTKSLKHARSHIAEHFGIKPYVEADNQDAYCRQRFLRHRHLYLKKRSDGSVYRDSSCNLRPIRGIQTEATGKKAGYHGV